MQWIRVLYRAKQCLFLCSDLLAYLAGFFLAFFLRYKNIPDSIILEKHLLLFAILFPLWIILNYINALYDLQRIPKEQRYTRRYLETGGLALFLGIIFFYLLPLPTITPKTILLLTVLFGYTIAFLFRIGLFKLIGLPRLQHHILFIGCNPHVLELIRLIDTFPHKGYRNAVIIDPNIKDIQSEIPEHIECYSNLKAIRPAISNHNIDVVVMTPAMQEEAKSLRELYQLLFWPVELMSIGTFYEQLTGRIPPFTFSETWFLQHLRPGQHPMYEKWRRLLDYIAACIIGLFFLLVLPFIAVAIKLNSKGPVFLKQERVGLSGKKFWLYKFRSMYALAPDGSAEVDGYQFAQKDDKRVTAVGKFIRKTRLDELPQVINLFKRDITLIGPRPERPMIVDELTNQMPYYPLRHVVRPGLTGWAVLHQHYGYTLEMSLQKLQYDLYYIKNRSFFLDISIVLKTVNVVVRGLGQ